MECPECGIEGHDRSTHDLRDITGIDHDDNRTENP